MFTYGDAFGLFLTVPLMQSSSESLNVDTPMAAYDDAWLTRCTVTLLCRKDELAYCEVHDPVSGLVWEAVRASIKSPSACQRLVGEYRLPLDPQWAVVPVALIKTAEGPVLLFRKSQMRTLDHLLAKGQLPISKFLAIANSTAQALASAHGAGVLHGNLRADQILVGKDSSVQLTGFCPSMLNRPVTAIHRSPSWPYMSPEQLRPIGADADARSDLYSLGVILYRASTGQFPLLADDAAHWIHAHLAVQPVSPTIVNPEIPEIVGDLIMKAMAKDRNARYQSAESLRADLAYSFQQFKTLSTVLPFGLGRFDTLPTIAASKSLYGRKLERDELLNAARRVAQTGTSEIVFVKGPAGSGKSALVWDALSQIDGSTWASGKTDVLQREVPYAPWSQIFKSLTAQALGRNSRELQTIKSALLDQLKGRGRLLADLVPDIETIIGDTKPLPDMPAQHATDRANWALLHALRAFTKSGHTLVIFIDDFQWADKSTLSLLTAFLYSPPKHVLLVIAYRNDEVQAQSSHGYFLGLTKSHNATPVLQIDLAPLSIAAVSELIAASLDLSQEGAVSLGEVLHAKTAGNPFFVHQLMRSLIDDRIVRFDLPSRSWTWSKDQVAKQGHAENVVDLMIRRLARLPAQEKTIMRLAGCVGAQCDETLLSRLTRIDAGEVMGMAKPLLEAGLLSYNEGCYSFPHDRVQEAAYKLTAKAERNRQHATIASAMLDIWAGRFPERTFEIANQIQRTARKSCTKKQSIAFVQLLLEAARRAKAAAALEQASEYLGSALILLGSDCWLDDYDLSFAVQSFAAECDMLLAKFDSSLAHIKACLTQAKTPLDNARIYKLKATLLTLRSDYDGSISAALCGLDHLGVTLDRYPSEEHLDQAYRRIRELIGTRQIGELGTLPEAQDRFIWAAMELLTTFTSAFFVKDGLAVSHLAKMVEITLTHGCTAESPYALAWFGVMIADRYSEYADGQAFAQAAQNLISRHGYDRAKTATHVAMDQVSAWTFPLAYGLEQARLAITTGQTGDDLAMACYGCNHVASDLLIMGEHLGQVDEDIERGLALVRQFQYVDIERILTAQRLFASDLQHYRPDRRLDAIDDEEQDEFGPIIRDRISQPTLFWTWFYSGMSAYYYGDVPYALRRFADAYTLVWSLPAHIDLVHFYLFHGLALSHSKAPGSVAQKLEALAAYQDKFAQWDALNPPTFRNKLLLIKGLVAHLKGDDLCAIRYFDESAIAAAASGFNHEHALAHELLAQTCISHGMISGTHHHLRMARDCYRLWGANGKVRQLEALHSFLSNEPAADRANNPTEPSLDLAVGIKAARALSEEVLLERLIETLVTNLIVHAGADLGMLMMPSSGDLTTAAAGRVVDGEVRVSIEAAHLKGLEPPLSVLNATMRTRKALVVEDAQALCPEAYRGDLMPRDTRSVLCLPLLKQGLVIGLIYLENSSVSGMFNPQRLAMLEILASQAAVSLETARLYEQLVEDAQTKAEMEEELRSSRAELARGAHLTVMGELSASIAHEISQPLLGIVSNAAASLSWLTRKAPNIEEAVLGLEDIRADGERATSIVQALRSLAKHAPPQLQIVNLGDVIREVVRLVAVDSQRNNVSIDIEVASETLALADRTQIQQVIYNLINNSLEAVAMSAAPKGRIIITSHTNDGWVQVWVDDNGPGIPPENRDRIFEAFYTTKGSGMGMGLAICRSVLRAHGGTLTAEDGLNGGARIRFSLRSANQM